MLGTTLAKTLQLLKAELGSSLTVGTSEDSRYYLMMETQQEWFASMYDWNQLRDKWETPVDAGFAGKYTAFPTQNTNGDSHAINFDRPLVGYVNYSDNWQELGFRIGVEEYNVRNSDADDAETQDPAMKWDFKSGNYTQFEIWPLGTVQQTIRFEGQRKVTSVRTGADIDSTKTLDLDDRLIALSVAIDILTAKEDPAVRAKTEKLNSLWQVLRAAESKSSRSFPLGSGLIKPSRRVVPITVG